MAVVADDGGARVLDDLTDRQLRNLIGGEWREPSSDRRLEVLDPATGQKLTTYASSTSVDVDLAMKAARDAQASWEARTVAHRSGALFAFASLLEENFDELCRLEAIDAGKPITAVRDGEVPAAIDAVRFAAGAVRSLEATASGPLLEDSTSIFVREPYGVMAAITPWNFPLLQATTKFAAAIAAGNTVVLKPAELTPLSTARVTELAAEVLPPGVLNLVLGSGPETGEALVRHPEVDLVSFTGSVRVGSQVGSTAGEMVRPAILELGGNAPVLVFADADLESAIEKIGEAGLYNAGQECMAASRVLVEQSRYDDFVVALAARAGRHVVGDNLDPATEMGPLVSAAQRDRVEDKIARRSAGSEIITGGSRLDRPGYYLEPTVVAGVTAAEELVAEETFGPVFTVQPFADEAEAVALANGTEYGLAASIWTADAGRAIRLGHAVKAGNVWVNNHLNLAAEIPITGFKFSGFGTENGIQGLHSVTRLKHLALSHR